MIIDKDSRGTSKESDPMSTSVQIVTPIRYQPLVFSSFKNEKHQLQVATYSDHNQLYLQEKDWVITKEEGSCSVQGTNKYQEKETFKGKTGEEAVKHSRSRGIFLGKHPALSIRCDYFKNCLCDEEDEMTAEIQGSDVAQPLPGDVEYAECMFCMCLFSVGNDCENWIHCGICCKWSQTLCAHLEGEVFFCDMCK